MDWEPYAHALQQGVFASRFPARGSTLWTIVNRNEYAVEGEQLAVAHESGAQYFDLWSGNKLAARIEDVGLRVGQRFAQANHGRIADQEGGGPDRGLRRTINIPQLFRALTQSAGQVSR